MVRYGIFLWLCLVSYLMPIQADPPGPFWETPQMVLENVPNSIADMKIAVNNSEQAILAWIEASVDPSTSQASFRIMALRKPGPSWEVSPEVVCEFSTLRNAPGTISDLKVLSAAINELGVPAIACLMQNDSSSSATACGHVYNGTSWDQGGPYPSSWKSLADGVPIAIDDSGTAVIAFFDPDDSTAINTAVYTSGLWTPGASIPFSPGLTNYPDFYASPALCANASGDLVVAWVEGSTDSKSLGQVMFATKSAGANAWSTPAVLAFPVSQGSTIALSMGSSKLCGSFADYRESFGFPKGSYGIHFSTQPSSSLSLPKTSGDWIKTPAAYPGMAYGRCCVNKNDLAALCYRNQMGLWGSTLMPEALNAWDTQKIADSSFDIRSVALAVNCANESIALFNSGYCSNFDSLEIYVSQNENTGSGWQSPTLFSFASGGYSGPAAIAANNAGLTFAAWSQIDASGNRKMWVVSHTAACSTPVK